MSGWLSVGRDWLRILSGCCCSCRAVGCFPGRSSGCRLVVGWSGCCCPHVGRFSVVLSHLVGVSVAFDGVPRWREGVAVILSGVLLMLSDWLPIGCRWSRGALRCQLVGGVGLVACRVPMLPPYRQPCRLLMLSDWLRILSGVSVARPLGGGSRCWLLSVS